MNAVSNEPRSSKATCRITVHILLSANDGSGHSCSNAFSALTSTSPLATNWHHPIGIIEGKADGPVFEKRCRFQSQQAAAGSRDWTRNRPGYRVEDGPVEMLRCCASGGSTSSSI